MKSARVALVGALASAVPGLNGCVGSWTGGGSGQGGGNYGITLPDVSCTTADLWEVRGLQYEHFPPQAAGELLSATLHRGDVVRLQVTTRYSGNCEAAIGAVQWVSTSPDVAEFGGTSREADLRARNQGETRVYANVTLRGGGQPLVAELQAVPSPGSPVLRVYTVRVVR